MSDDKTLLLKAAKAAGINHPGGEHSIHDDGRLWDCAGLRWWNPLTDDGDALRLAVKLGIDIEFEKKVVFADGSNSEFTSENATAATRRAIVRAAANIEGFRHD